ncbi:MAG: HAMP domain-containing sensor histidine kinase [Planctomycetota bacterium]|nr:HAMP domain-containing sensor histidine kinase [Planctomycetota bacterium]
MNRWRSSVRLRLATLYVAGLGVVLLLFGSCVFVLVRARVMQSVEVRSQAELARLASYLQQEGISTSEEMEEPGYEPYLVVGPDGSALYASSTWRDLGLPQAPRELAPAGGGEAREPALHVSSLSFRCANQDVTAYVAIDTGDTRRSLSILMAVLLGGTAAALVAALFLGYWLAGRALAPVAALARAAERVGVGDVTARLPVGVAQDEFDRLAEAFNAVLERLQTAIEELRRFSSNVSHELRTPLAAMRSVGEQALRRGTDARGEEAIGSMLEEVDRLTSLIEQLLALARTEATGAGEQGNPVDPAAVAREVVNACLVLAEEREQELVCELEEGLVVTAHPLLLRQALYNLLDNAIRCTPPRGHVRVRVRRLSNDESVIEVVDDGPGIAPEDQQRIFTRFERVDRDAAASGAGLGLAIAKRAIEACRGRIELASALGVGSCFRIVLLHGREAVPRREEQRPVRFSPNQGVSHP